MSKQTRLNFSKVSSTSTPTSSKRRRLNSSDETNNQRDISLEQSKPASPTKSKTNKPKVEASPNSEHTKTQVPSNPKSTTPEAPNETKATTPEPPNEAKSPTHLKPTYQKASLFASPPATALCHATNAQGTWGAGIAAAFKKTYPSAFKAYATHCAAWDSSSLLGTTFLIPPQKKSASKAEREAEHWIGCLFTSEKKGKGKGSKESILAATGEAVEDLVRQVRAVNEAADAAAMVGKSKSDQDRITGVRMCKINSGLFGVPWEATSEVIEAVEVGDGDVEEIAVFSVD